jgi:phosphate transport system substrate-binding protein
MARVALQTYGALCYNRRTDDAIVYANDQEYWNNPALQPTGPADVAVGPYRLLAKAPDSVPLPLEGITPSDPTIADGTYPGSRMVTLFVKTEKYNIVPGLQQFVIEMTSPEAIGPGGYLTKRGLVPLPDVQLREVGVAARFSTQ